MTQKSSDAFLRDAPFSVAPDGMLRREDFTRERIDWLRERGKEIGQDWVLSHEERDASRAEATGHLIAGEPVWVFGYGSLMWNPAIHVVTTERAQVFGYHRSFCLNLIFGRGSPEYPGLMLALDTGGSCVGLAHKIAPEHVESELDILWMREMTLGSYKPVWLTARFATGPRTVLTFAANKAHERYVGPQPFGNAARRIAISEGYVGDNRTYLYNTVRHLDELGIKDGSLHKLEREVRRIADEPDPQ